VFTSQGKDFFWELATLIVIMLLGHWIEMRSVMGASKALSSLAALMPEEAHLVGREGAVRDVPVDSLQEGDTVLVKPGEKVPIDGTVIEGTSSVNEAMLTGESAPVSKKKGDTVIGGGVNGEGALRFRVDKVGEDTFLSQVIRLVRDAQASKSRSQRLADTAAKWLFYISAGAGSLTFGVWLGAGQEFSFAIERAVTVMVISCPHALGLAIPLVTAVSTSIAAQKGLLIRNRAAFEKARKVDTVVFDKTGTLTAGTFGVADILEKGAGRQEILSVAYAVEKDSAHPIARAIVEEGEKSKIEHLHARDAQSITGKGMHAEVDGRDVAVVSPGYLREKGIGFDEEEYGRLAEQGKTVVFVLADKTVLGVIALADRLRETAQKAVQTLLEMGVDPVMLTGDNQNAASFVGRALGIKRILAEVLPADKANEVKKLQNSGAVVAMTGDGVNDAPSLAQADVGVAIGAGTDVAVETADVILVKSNPLDVINILKLSRATYKKMVQNLFWATAYNAVAIPLAAGVLYSQGIVKSPALGAVLMSVSTVIVSVNARFLKIE
jgi:Cu2+-exporting ATPase